MTYTSHKFDNSKISFNFAMPELPNLMIFFWTIYYLYDISYITYSLCSPWARGGTCNVIIIESPVTVGVVELRFSVHNLEWIRGWPGKVIVRGPHVTGDIDVGQNHGHNFGCQPSSSDAHSDDGFRFVFDRIWKVWLTISIKIKLFLVILNNRVLSGCQTLALIF